MPSTPGPDGETDRDRGADLDGGADLERVADIERGAGLDRTAGLDIGTGAPPAADLDAGTDLGGADLEELARTAGTSARRFNGLVAGVTFVVLHGVVLWLVLSLGLVAPPWAVTVLLAVWLGVAVVGWRGRTRRPLVTMLLPIATAGVVLCAVVLGARLLGWSA